MNIRSQIDTSMYNRGGQGTSIGEALGAVQGVMSIVGKAKERKKEQKDTEDNEYLNTTFGKHLNGWNGTDQNDFLARTNSAMTEVLSNKPELYSKAAPEIGKAVKAVRDAEDQQLQSEGKKLANQGAEQDVYSKKISNKKLAQDFLIKENELITKFLDVDNPEDYKFGKMYLNGRLGVTPNVPDTFEEFAPNKKAFLDKAQMEKQRLEKELADIDLNSKKSGLTEQKNQEKISGVNADYIEREKQAGLSKTYADINKKKTGFDSDLINQVKEKMLSDPALNELIKLYAYGNISEQEMMAKMPGFGGAKSGDIRMAFTSAAIDLNPPQYDANQNLIGGFSPKQFSIARGSESGSTRFNARLQDQKVTTANSAMVLINHVIDPQTEKISDMKSITPQFAAELALNAARLVSPSGQVGIELMREFKQNTLTENVAKTLAYFGLTSAGTTEANLRNIKAFIKREGELAQKTRDTYYSGEGNNVGFDSPDLTGGSKKPVSNVPSAPATSFDELWAKHGGK
ncbi:MAG: hypothetical protein PHN44_01320 [Candidatus Marinimicrobia bacterium]|nr:hypothetical protein [Candidatus Neomarinimicrobiota bacterium]